MSTKSESILKLGDIKPWWEYVEKLVADNKIKESSLVNLHTVNSAINCKVSVHQGDITKLAIEAIVNAANEALRGGGGVDGAIQKAAGKDLLRECEALNGCDAGDAKMTNGYKLPAKYVIHTVGPRGEKPDTLKSCYQRCFELVLEKKLKSIAFPCISTGIFGYPRKKAADVALTQTRLFLENHSDKVDRVIFCVFLDEDLQVYEELMQSYFPVNEVEVQN